MNFGASGAQYSRNSSLVWSPPPTLYRSWHTVTGDHFYTTSLAEHNAAVAGDYVDEGVACYVW